MLEPPTFTYLDKFGHSAHTFSNKAALYIFLHALRYMTSGVLTGTMTDLRVLSPAIKTSLKSLQRHIRLPAGINMS
ncbi:hypothetical protein M405DRAFT_938625 [Rhizopogon salebrosus TDB-379]|nr:hypothetical protein M405DRAFT_938625 [Rhizopogon salebrosus TDB-379]